MFQERSKQVAVQRRDCSPCIDIDARRGIGARRCSVLACGTLGEQGAAQQHSCGTRQSCSRGLLQKMSSGGGELLHRFLYSKRVLIYCESGSTVGPKNSAPTKN